MITGQLARPVFKWFLIASVKRMLWDNMSGFRTHGNLHPYKECFTSKYRTSVRFSNGVVVTRTRQFMSGFRLPLYFWCFKPDLELNITLIGTRYKKRVNLHRLASTGLAKARSGWLPVVGKELELQNVSLGSVKTSGC